MENSQTPAHGWDDSLPPPENPRHFALSRTTDRVLQILLGGDLSRLRADSVAESLGMSSTTLRRRLRADHTCYQFLLDRARRVGVVEEDLLRCGRRCAPAERHQADEPLQPEHPRVVKCPRCSVGGRSSRKRCWHRLGRGRSGWWQGAVGVHQFQD